MRWSKVEYRRARTNGDSYVVDAVMPKVTASLNEKSESGQIDLATAESHLIRQEVARIYNRVVSSSLDCEVRKVVVISFVMLIL